MTKLTKSAKLEKAQGLAQELKAASYLVFADYQGMKFGDISGLRAKLRPMSCRFRVMKNSLVGHALKNAEMGGGRAGFPQDLLKGPLALVIAEGGDPSSSAKLLVSFAKEVPQLKLKAAYVQGSWMDSASVRRLAQLPGKNQLLTDLAGVLYSALSQAACVLQAPMRDLVYALKAVEDQKTKGVGG